MGKKKNAKPAEKSWFMKLLCNILGTVFIVLPILIFMALADYHIDDPSFNKVVSADIEIKNFLGKFGACSADAVLSTFGLAFIIFLTVPIFWGVGLCRYHAFAEYKTRIFAWFVGLLSFATFTDLVFSSYLGRFNLPYNLTGEWSRVLSRPLNSSINLLNIPYNTIMLEGIILFVSVLSYNFSSGLTFKIWLRFCSGFCRFTKSVFLKIAYLFKRIIHIRDFREFKELNPSYLQNKMHSGISAAKNRREPGFEHQDTLVRPVVAADSPADTSLPSGPTIEIPQSVPADSAEISRKKPSFSPTFDFIKDEQPTPKKAAKLQPEDIYQTEKTRSVAAKSKTPAVSAIQEDLLSIPSESKSAENSALQTQHPSSAALPFSSDTPQSAEYMLPNVNLLSVPQNSQVIIDEAALKNNATQLEQVLKDFGIRGQIVKVRPGPVVTLYELEPAPGTRTARVIGLSDDIARSMAVSSVRMAVVSGHNTIGIELPNENRQTVWLRELLENSEFTASKNILNVALGKDIGGQPVYADLSKMPHLLVAGTTGSGKSVGVNTMILSLLFKMTPEQCKFIMIDPKQLEFSMYNGIPHLLTPVITDPAKAVVGLKWAVQEMENRYRSMALLNVRNIAGYNKKVAELNKSGKEIKKTIQTGFDKETGLPIYKEQKLDTSPMPYIVIVVDEMADLMLVAGKEVEAAIQRLAQMARAAGIHLIMSTQRPSVDVITGVIKANFPSRISFHVTNKFDSTTILGEKGAEQLLGMGDMLFMASGSRPTRVHGCFVADEEVEGVVEYIKSQAEPQYVAEVTAGELNTKDSGPVFDKGEMGGDSEEELYRQAVEIVRADKKASTSYVQRKLRIGYNRAANLIERMEREGIVTKQDHVGRREVIDAA